MLPPGAIKDAEGVGECSQVFFVSECQDGAGDSIDISTSYTVYITIVISELYLNQLIKLQIEVNLSELIYTQLNKTEHYHLT
jgi:hypothetical protein